MQLGYFFSRSAILAVSVIVVSLMIAIQFDTEDSASQEVGSIIEGNEPPSPSPADAMSLMQGAHIQVELLGQYDRDKPAVSRSHSEKDQTRDMDDTSFFGGAVRTKVKSKTGHRKSNDNGGMSGKMGLPGTGLARSSWNAALNLRTALMQSFMQVRTTQTTSTIAIVMIILLVSCTCVGALSIAYPSKFPFFGGGRDAIPDEPDMLQQRELMLERKWPPAPRDLAAAGGAPGPFLRSAFSPFAHALMPSPFMTSDHMEHSLETEPVQQEPDPQEASTPPPLCPSLVMPVCEARFGVPMYELAQLDAEGEVGIVGLSGNPLLRAVVRKIGNARTLEISMPEHGSAPRATITPSMMELAGHSQQGCRALEIRGMRGSFYGVLEMRSSGACYVIREGQTVMMIDGDAESLQLSIKSSSGVQLASVRCSAEPFGGVDHVEIRVEPGVDTVLILAVVLAVLLLSPYMPPPDQ